MPCSKFTLKLNKGLFLSFSDLSVLLRSCWWYRETSLSPSVDNIGHLSCFDTKTEGTTIVHYDCEASIIFQIHPNLPLKNITVLPNKDFEVWFELQN